MERLERYSLECEGLAPGVNDGWPLAHVAVPFCENREAFAERRIERGGGLYLRRDELSAVVFQKIDFHALGVPIEIEARPVAVVVCAFHRLKNDKTLEKRSAERIAVQLFGFADASLIAVAICLSMFMAHIIQQPEGAKELKSIPLLLTTNFPLLKTTRQKKKGLLP